MMGQHATFKPALHLLTGANVSNLGVFFAV